MRKFTIARVHYNGMFDALEWSKSVLIDISALTRLEEFVKSDGYYWSFTEAGQDDVEGKQIVSLRIIKIKPIQELEVVDEATRTESLTEVADVKERDGMLYIDIDTHLAAIETHGYFTNRQIEGVLVEGYKKLGLNYEPTFDYTYDDDRIMEKLSQFDAAKVAQFSLTTTNPHANEEFRPLDNQLRTSGVQRSQFRFTPKEAGKLDIHNEGSIVRQSLMMAAAGYGSGRITGYDAHNRPLTLELGDSLVDRVEVHESLTDNEVIKRIIVKFKQKDKSSD